MTIPENQTYQQMNHSLSMYQPSRAMLFSLCVLLCMTTYQVSRAWAQSETEQRKLRLAQSYEQSGDHRNAARLYQELYEANKHQAEYFDGTVRSLLALGNPNGVVSLVEEQLQLHVQHKQSELRLVELLALKGDVLWKTGKTAQASEAWKQALTTAGSMRIKRDSAYIRLARAQVQNRVFDQAIATLTQARTDLNAPLAFTDDLSQLYGAVGNYAAGVQEVLTLLKIQGSLNVAQGRIAAYLINDKGIAQTNDALERAASAEPNNPLVQRLLLYFLRETKQFDRAVDVAAHVDGLVNAQGRELLAFAELSRRERQYSTALKAFGLVIDKGKRNPNALSALYGYARTMESRLQDSGALSSSEASTILDRYRQIVNDYPNTPYAAEAQYRLSVLLHASLGKSEQAVQELTRLLEQFRAYPIAAKGAVELGNIYITLRQTSKAESAFRLASTAFPHSPTERDEALFRLAELEYFRCALDSAQEHFGALAVNTNADIANDALEMLSLLDLKRSPAGNDALCAFAQAELTARQQQPDAAVSKYAALAATLAPNSPAALLGELSLLNIAKIEVARKRYDEAIKSASELLEKYPDGTYGDAALMLTGDAQAAQNRKNEAMQTYSLLLVKYPRSTFLQEARQKIRKLRGDV